MSLRYPLSVLRKQRNNLEDRLAEIEEGQYSKHSEEQVEKFKEDVQRYLEDINQVINVLENYIES